MRYRFQNLSDLHFCLSKVNQDQNVIVPSPITISGAIRLPICGFLVVFTSDIWSNWASLRDKSLQNLTLNLTFKGHPTSIWSWTWTPNIGVPVSVAIVTTCLSLAILLLRKVVKFSIISYHLAKFRMPHPPHAPISPGDFSHNRINSPPGSDRRLPL